MLRLAKCLVFLWAPKANKCLAVLQPHTSDLYNLHWFFLSLWSNFKPKCQILKWIRLIIEILK